MRGVPSAGSLESGPLDRWLTPFIPRELVEDHIRSRARAFLLMRFTMVAAICTVVFAPYFALYLKLPYTGLMNILYGISLALTPVILHRTRSLRITANWTLSSAFAVLLFQSWVLGGVSSLSYPWLACVPMAAMLLRGVRGGALWTLVSVMGVVGVGTADMMGLLPQEPASVVTARGATMVTIAALTLTLGGLAWLAESRAEDLLQDLQRQKVVFQERAVRDWLTGLANRSLLTECLIQSWERARRHGPRMSLRGPHHSAKHPSDRHHHSRRGRSGIGQAAPRESRRRHVHGQAQSIAVLGPRARGGRNTPRHGWASQRAAAGCVAQACSPPARMR